jgi:subtilisin family serine protease
VIPGVQILVVESHSETGTVERLAKVRTAIANAVKAGVVVVIPAGNKPPSADAASELDLEKKFDTGSIIVGAVGADGKKLASSNFGDRVTVAAFGEKVRTLIGRGGQMGNFGGTSAATPQVAATVALMLEVHPELSPRQVRSILSDTARNRAGSKTVGGVLDVFAAVNRAATRKRH